MKIEDKLKIPLQNDPGTLTAVSQPTVAWRTSSAERRYIMGIDPGVKKTALVVLRHEGGVVKRIYKIYEDNERIKTPLEMYRMYGEKGEGWILVIEGIQCFGMPVGQDVFETAYWIGEFRCIWKPRPFKMIFKNQIKTHFCGTNKAKKGNIRQVLIDRFGKPGTKKNPGLLYGIKSHLWDALAVAVYELDTVYGRDSA